MPSKKTKTRPRESSKTPRKKARNSITSNPMGGGGDVDLILREAHRYYNRQAYGSVVDLLENKVAESSLENLNDKLDYYRLMVFSLPHQGRYITAEEYAKKA
ncbi:MAG: hypothetical protein NTV06_07995, partial [candidate division Zixibacteria bacterium]|nr:hypothetical protein [candidate division Zixibacteria bacterium]